MTMSTSIDVYVDYVCPYCFLVEGALQEVARDRDVQIRTEPFELRPDPVPTLRPEDDYLPRVWADSVYPMAERIGVVIQLPSISPQPRTAKAFVGLQVAQEQGLGEAYSTEVFKAFFQQDRDIGDEAELASVAATVGIEPDAVTEALGDPERRERQRSAQRHATRTVGITAVPSIFVNGVHVHGVPSADRLTMAVDRFGPTATVEGR